MSMTHSEIELESLVDRRILHKSKNTEQIMKFMQDDINELKTNSKLQGKDMDYMKKGIDEIKIFMAKSDERYATKIEHKQNREDIEKINKIFFWLGTLIIGAIILAVLNQLLWK